MLQRFRQLRSALAAGGCEEAQQAQAAAAAGGSLHYAQLKRGACPLYYQCWGALLRQEAMLPWLRKPERMQRFGGRCRAAGSSGRGLTSSMADGLARLMWPTIRYAYAALQRLNSPSLSVSVVLSITTLHMHLADALIDQAAISR